MAKSVSQAEWHARVNAWQDRVAKYGVERSIYHIKHQAPDFPAVTALQQQAIWPHFLAARSGLETRALDFGCGYGRWTPQLAATIGYALGVDPTPDLLTHAVATRPPLARGVLEYRLYEQGHIPAPDRHFDVLWCCMVLSTVLEDRMFAATLTELRRVLQPGALILLTDNTSREDGRPIRSRYSMSRTIAEYTRAFASWASLRPVGDYVDRAEINTVFAGRVHV